MSAERNKQVIESLYAAFGDPNVDFGEHCGKFLTPDCRWAVSYMPTTTAVEAGVAFVQPFTGPEGVKQYFKLFQDSYDVGMLVPEKIIAGDDKVLSWTHQKLTSKKTGKQVEDYVLHEFTLTEDGKISEHVHWCDTAKHIAALQP